MGNPVYRSTIYIIDIIQILDCAQICRIYIYISIYGYTCTEVCILNTHGKGKNSSGDVNPTRLNQSWSPVLKNKKDYLSMAIEERLL